MLVVTMIAAFIIAGNQAYTPQYQAKVTYAVNKTSIAEVDASIAQRLSGSISAVVSTGEFKERLFAGVEPEDVNENYSITSAYTENSNLFAVTVTANNYNNANMVMELFEKMYPEWVASPAWFQYPTHPGTSDCGSGTGFRYSGQCIFGSEAVI